MEGPVLPLLAPGVILRRLTNPIRVTSNALRRNLTLQHLASRQDGLPGSVRPLPRYLVTRVTVSHAQRRKGQPWAVPFVESAASRLLCRVYWMTSLALAESAWATSAAATNVPINRTAFAPRPATMTRISCGGSWVGANCAESSFMRRMPALSM